MPKREGEKLQISIKVELLVRIFCICWIVLWLSVRV